MTELDPDEFAALLVPVESVQQIDALPPDTSGVIASALDDARLARLAAQLPGLRYLVTDGKARVTDDGLAVLRDLPDLELLDLEYGSVTDNGLGTIGELARLRWVDLGGCPGITSAGITELEARRPELMVEFW